MCVCMYLPLQCPLNDVMFLLHECFCCQVQAKTTTTNKDGKVVPQKINKKWIEAGEWEVDIAGVRYPARASAAPLYDPKNERIKA